MQTMLVVFGTRPEAIKMAPVVHALRAQPDDFRVVVCSTGQHREMLDQVLELFQIVPDYELSVMTPGQSLPGLTAAVLSAVDPVLVAEQPDWVLVQGDTTTAMAASLGAFYRGAKVAHVEAGLRTDDKLQPFPEEINRRITGVLADMHFPPTQWAQANLLREGVPAERMVVTGNTVIDAIQDVVTRPFDPSASGLAGIIDPGKRTILVTAHRRESFGQGMEHICQALRTIAERGDVQIVYPVHLNPNVQEPVRRLLGGVEGVHLLPPMDYQPLVWLLSQADLVITDSGGLQEEAPGLGKPVLVLRERTERPEGVEAGTVRLVGTDPSRIVGEANRLLDNPNAYDAMAQAVNPYGDGRAAKRIAASLASTPH